VKELELPNLKTINFGGGFSIPYTESEEEEDLDLVFS
jgi:diaminopimelate decarboxylase